MKRLIGLLFVTVLVFGIVGSVNAALIVRGTDSLGNKLIYDDDLDITWYDYSNPEATWGNQMAWADGLSISFNGDTINDWRLPETPATERAEYTNEGEMGHLFYDELGLDSGSTSTAELNASEFDNLIAGWYWTGTENDYNPDGAWDYDLGDGFQDIYNKVAFNDYGLAVRSGDVSAVPIPGGIYLLGSGLIGLVSISRRKQGNRR